MKAIVIYTTGTQGDLVPFLALGRALAVRGLRVRMAVNPAMVEQAQTAGLETVAVNEHPLDAGLARQFAGDWDHWGGVRKPSLDEYAAMARPVLRSLIELCNDAELLISTSIRPWAAVAHHVTNVPWVTVSLVPVDFGESEDAAQRQAARQWRAPDLAELHRYLSYACVGMGVSLPEDLPRLASRLLLAYSRHFFEPRSDHPDLQGTELHQTGFWFDEESAATSWQPPESLARLMSRSVRPIVLSFSSLPVVDRAGVLNVHAEAAARIGLPLLVQRGWAGFSVDDLAPEHLGGDVHFCDFVPHDWLFARAACAIQHGGIGSLGRALTQGCPVLIEPYGNDQFFNALRVVLLGVGAAMHPGKLTVEGLVRVLQEKVLTAERRSQCAALGSRLASESGLEAACVWIQKQLQDKMAPL